MWADTSTAAFETKFLHHEIPAVINVASLWKRAQALREERTLLKNRLEQMQKDRMHNNYIPAELFHFIEGLRAELASVRLELAEEKRAREEDKKAMTVWMESMIYFDIFSAPQFVVTSKNFNFLKNSSNTMTYSGPSGVHNYAISSIPLCRDRPYQWKVEILSLSKDGWVLLGIIGKLLKSADGVSRHDNTCYGWGGRADTRTAGQYIKNPLWSGWKVGDCGVFTFDPEASTLSLKLLRGNTTEEFRMIGCVNPQAFLLCDFRDANTVVRFSEVQ